MTIELFCFHKKMNFVFLCLSSASEVNRKMGKLGLTVGDNLSFPVSEHEKIFLSTQKYIFFGDLSVFKGEEKSTLKYNESVVLNESFSLYSKSGFGPKISVFYWKTNDSETEDCTHSFSIINKNYAKIKPHENEKETFCYFFSTKSSANFDIEGNSSNVRIYSNAGNVPINDNNAFIRNSESNLNFFVTVKNNASVTINCDNQIIGDLDSAVQSFDDYKGENYIDARGKVAWWVWTIIFGIVGIIVIVFGIYGCGEKEETEFLPLYYWSYTQPVPNNNTELLI